MHVLIKKLAAVRKAPNWPIGGKMHSIAYKKAESAETFVVAPSLRVSRQTRFLFSMEAEVILEGSHCGLGEISFV